MRTALAVIALTAVVIAWFVYQGFAEYSSSPDSSVALCYTENWSATDYVVLNQQEGTNAYTFSYSRSADPAGPKDQRAYDFVPTKWEVTGNVSFKSQ